MAKPQRPAVGLDVIVRTPDKIDGQNEHAAVITKVVDDDDTVNVTISPSGLAPYPVMSVRHFTKAGVNSITWRWPSRT